MANARIQRSSTLNGSAAGAVGVPTRLQRSNTLAHASHRAPLTTATSKVQLGAICQDSVARMRSFPSITLRLEFESYSTFHGAPYHPRSFTICAR